MDMYIPDYRDESVPDEFLYDPESDMPPHERERLDNEMDEWIDKGRFNEDNSSIL